MNLRKRIALAGAGLLVVGGVVLPMTAAQAAVSCAVTVQAGPWTEGPGVGGYTANLTINNTGDPWTSWTMVITLPSGQSFQHGWNATYTPSGSTLTAVNVGHNGNVPTGGSTTIGYNGRWTGSFVAPSVFSVNGVTCGGSTPPVNQAPTVSLTSPTGGANFASGAAIPLSANASDPDGTINRVEFLIDGTVVGQDTSSPYTFSATGVANGNHTAAARAFDNASPQASTTTANVSFSVGGTTTPSISATPATQTVSGGTTATVTLRRSVAPTANVTVTVTRSGSTAVTCPGTATITTANWSTGVNLSCTVATGTTAATSTFTAAATGHTSAQFSISRSGPGGPGRADNPYAGATVYNNPDWRAKANSVAGGNRISMQPTGVWLDRIAAIAGSPGVAMGLEQHLNEAVAQDAANGSSPLVIQFVIYNLPGRDCSALASNGELGVNDLPRYQAEYIDVIAGIMGRAAYANLRIVAIIEIDSLPNLVTNLSVAKCATMNSNGGYVNGVGYALDKLGNIANVYNYVDAAHHGWIGWNSNFVPTAQKLAQAANANGATPADVHGFITNTANYSALQEPHINLQGQIGGQQIRSGAWIDWNDYNDELSFATAFRNQLVSQGFSSSIGMLIDTSRNGWGSCVQAPCPALATRPSGPGTSTDLNTFINQSRIDRRIHKGNWCNQTGAGLGERPQANPAPGIDAYVWIKPPGESDGSSTEIPNNEGKGFDRMCDPTYQGNNLNKNNFSGALGNAPISGHWFAAQFSQLMANAYPPLP